MKIYLFTWSMFCIVKTANFRLRFNLEFLCLNLDISATGSMSHIFHTSNFGADTSNTYSKYLIKTELEIELDFN